MDTILNLIIATPPEKLVKENNEDSFVKPGFAVISDALASLDVEKYTAGMVLLLAAQNKLIEKDKDVSRAADHQESWVDRVGGLLPLFDTRQLLLVLTQLKTICQTYTDCMVRKKAISGIKPMRTLIRRLSPGPTFITPQHAMFIELCIAAGAYTMALPILNDFPFELNPEKTGVDGRDVRLYLYYSGIAFIGNHRWNDAVEALRACVQVPAQGCSAIVIEAYKKYILASLIHRGEADPLSKSFIPSIQRHMKQYSLYDELAVAYGSQSLETLHKMISQNKDLLTREHNFGLCKQLFQSLQRRIVQSLTKTFITLSLSDIAQRIKLDTVEEAEAYILDCIKRGEIAAAISQKDGMVSFDGSVTQTNSNATREELDARLKEIIKVTAVLENADHMMALDQKYIEKMVSMDKAGISSAASRSFAMDVEEPIRA